VPYTGKGRCNRKECHTQAKEDVTGKSAIHRQRAAKNLILMRQVRIMKQRLALKFNNNDSRRYADFHENSLIPTTCLPVL